GEGAHQVLSPEDSERLRATIQLALTSNVPQALEFPYLTEDGQKLYDVHIQRLETPADSNRAVVAVLRDITLRKTAEERIQQLAFYDLLTNLPNRSPLLDRLRQGLPPSARRGCHGAVMFIDLHNFKHVNAAHGDAVGELVVQQGAQRVCRGVRGSATVARLGGDEFVVMLEVVDSQ